MHPFPALQRLMIRNTKTKLTGQHNRRIPMTELLIRKAKKGDADAFCRLMELETQNMYKIARAYLKNDEDAADAISDTILTCFEKLHTLQNNRYFKTWLIRILINKCKDIINRI